MTLAVAAGSARAQGAPTPVRAGTVKAEVIQERRQVTGELRAQARSEIAAREPGLVLEMLADEGTPVRAGDVLAKLDDRNLALEIEQLDAEVAEAEATIAERAAELNRARIDYDRVITLREQNASRPTEVAEVEADLHAAEARHLAAERRVDVLRARRRLLQKRLSDMTVEAPFDAVVIARHADEGEWLGVGDPVAELLRVDSLEAWLDVPQAVSIATGNAPESLRVRVEGLNVERSTGPARVVPLVDAIARTFTLAADVSNGDGLLKPGMAVTAWVPAGPEAERLTLPKDALLQGPTGPYVYAIRAGGEGGTMAIPTAVRTRFEVGGRVVIEPGALNAGDRVVTEGNERLFQATPVVVVNDAASGAAPEQRGTGGSSTTDESN